MKHMAVFIFFELIAGNGQALANADSRIIDDIISESIPDQSKFTEWDCYYCGIASKYIEDLVPTFPTFYDNEQSFRNYLDAVASLVCDEYGTTDARKCEITTSYVALYVYANWVGNTTSSIDEAIAIIDWANSVFPFCATYEETNLFCSALKGLSLSLSFCKEDTMRSLACPMKLTACEVCSHYFQCNKNSYC